MRIGFFGDSFCQEISNMHTQTNGYQTYIKKIKKYYNADIVHLGRGGSSIWDVIINQFPPFIKNLPDVCIFVWTDHGRLYHPKIHNLGPWNAIDKKKSISEFHYSDLFHKKEKAAASEFYKFLYDDKKAEHEARSALYYFDRTTLTELENKTKIIHLWSFGKYNNTNKETEYIYKFTTGVECHPPMKSFAMLNKPEKYNYSLDANHIHGNENNNILADLIISAINNYTTGNLIDYKL